jgi:hypothetical protein
VVGLAGLVPVQALSAGSVAYRRADNVYVTNLDGSATRQITTDGRPGSDTSWGGVSQSDTGVVVAYRNGFFWYFDYNGRKVDGPLAPGTESTGNILGFSLARTRLKPNADQIAFWWSGLANSSSSFVVSVKIGNRSPNSGGALFPNFADYAGAAWVGNSIALLSSDGTSTRFIQGASDVPWFNMADVQLGGRLAPSFDVARDGSRVLVRSIGQAGEPYLNLLSVPGGPPAIPQPSCEFPTGRVYDQPRFSADGADVVWEDSQGIWTARTPSPPGCQVTPRLLVAGASEPSPGALVISPAASGGPAATGGARDIKKPKATKIVTKRLRGLVTLRFKLDEPATMTGALRRRAKPKGKLTLVRRLAPRRLAKGQVSVPLGRLGPGAYRIELKLVDAAGNVGTLVRPFAVPRPKPKR